MRSRSFSLAGLVRVVVLAVAVCGCQSVDARGNEANCKAIAVAPRISGVFEASSVPFSTASELLVCVNDVCDAHVAERVSVQVERAPEEASGSPTPQPTKPDMVFVDYWTNASSKVEPRTGDVLRLRYPNKAEGPWSFDVSLEATVVPGDACRPTSGTFEP